MSRDSARPTPAEIVGELTRTLRALRRELRAADGRQGRGLDRLVQFTSEVTIPATILVLETNIRALQLLQRSLRLARDTDEASDQSRDVADLGQSVVGRIDEALSEAQRAVEKTSADEQARDLLDEAQELNRQLETQIDPDATNEIDPDASDEGESASVDVESELSSLRDEYGDDPDDGPADGTE